MNKKNIKILVDCHVFDQSLQGTTTYIKGIYKELIKNKDISFYFVTYKYDLVGVFGEDENITYLNYKFKNKFLRLLIDIPLIILKNKIDYAHFQYVVSPIKLCKYIVTIHDVLFLDYPEFFPLSYKLSKSILLKWSAKLADVLLTVSEYSKDRISEHFNVKNIQITPNAVDEIFFEEYNEIENKKNVYLKHGLKDYFLFVSRREPRKNHLTLLKTFVENEYYKDFQLVFIGTKAINDKNYDHYYNQLSNDVKAQIIELEKITFSDLLDITRAARLSIYPSVAEGFGIPPLESLACKIPTICSKTTAMLDFEFIKEFMFNPTDSTDLNNSIQKALLSDDFERLKLNVYQKYTWKNSSEVLLEIIRNEILN